MKTRTLLQIVVIIFLLMVGFSATEVAKARRGDILPELNRLYQKKDFQQVLDRLAAHPEVWNAHPDESSLLQLLSLLKLGKLTDAWDVLHQKVQEKNITIPDHLIAIYLDALLEKKVVPEAERALVLFRTISPNSPLLAFQSGELGEMVLQEKQYSRAVPYFTGVLSGTKDENLRLTASLGIVRSLTGQGKYLEAALFLKKSFVQFASLTTSKTRGLLSPLLKNLYPLDFPNPLRLDLAGWLSRVGYRKEARSFLDSVESEGLTLDQFKEIALLRIKLALSDNDIEGAEQGLSESLPLQSTPDFLFYRGVVDQRKGWYADAIQSYQQLLSMYPQNEYLLNTLRNLAFCYRVSGNDAGYTDTLQKTGTLFPDQTEVWWNLFWFFYQKNDYSSGGPVLDRLEQIESERNRSLFWRYKIDQTPHRFDYLKKIIASPNRDYYFVRAWQECKINHLSLPTANTLFPPRDYSSHISDGQLKEPAHWTKYLLFRQYDCPANAEFELREFRRENPHSPDLLLEFSRFYASTKKYQQSILHAIYFQANQPDATQYRNVWKKVYPIFFLKEIETWGKKYAVDPYLILSLIRTESTFAPEDVSTSGAIGLMQIMPATALWMVETKKSEVVPLEQWDPQLLRQPEINLRLGVDYFGYLMKYFTGKLCPAICAYNGGPDRVKTWLQERKTDDFDVFIEEIPYLETKNYIKKVMTFYFHYSLIYRGRFPLTPCIF